ncbi:hypothetical protein TETCHI2_000033 [Candidatus Hodgkinia cicadicola]|nr:hypothetical protein TETCHI2_000033 [Candidatus Hodgkinia cicadicola]
MTSSCKLVSVERVNLQLVCFSAACVVILSCVQYDLIPFWRLLPKKARTLGPRLGLVCAGSKRAFDDKLTLNKFELVWEECALASDSDAVCRAATAALLKHCKPTVVLKRLAKLARLGIDESACQFKLTWAGLGHWTQTQTIRAPVHQLISYQLRLSWPRIYDPPPHPEAPAFSTWALRS